MLVISLYFTFILIYSTNSEDVFFPKKKKKTHKMFILATFITTYYFHNSIWQVSIRWRQG